MFGRRNSRTYPHNFPLEPQAIVTLQLFADRWVEPWLRAAISAGFHPAKQKRRHRTANGSRASWLNPARQNVGLRFAVLAVLASLSAGSYAADQQAPQGAEIYKQSGCVVCHGGLGTGGFGPKLSGDPMLAISPFVVAQILIGRGQMPAFGDKLSDPQIAAVAQYIRTNWGNDFGPVTADQVTDTRNLMKRAAQIAAQASQPQQ
jgi:mono/diheme cytochrome c family protein